MIYSYNVKFQIFIYSQDHLFLPYGGHAICHLSRLFANNNNKKKKKRKRVGTAFLSLLSIMYKFVQIL